jgi:hypothetical protein
MFTQAQSVSSAKDRYLQRKAGASAAVSSSVKKERNGIESHPATCDAAAAASSTRVKQETDTIVSCAAIKRE